MEKERIIFYSASDLAVYSIREDIKIFIDKFDHKKNYNDINDIIELYNIKLYIDCGNIEKFLRDTCNYSLSEINKTIWSKINLYFNNVSNDNIETIYSQINDFMYKEQFWELFEKCKLYNKISKDIFTNLFNKTEHKEAILQNRGIVQKYDKTLTKLLKGYCKTAELLISNYEVHHDDTTRQLYFPKSLSLQEKDEIVSSYIDNNDCNINYVKIASIATDSINLKLSDVTKLKAKRKYNSEINRMHQNNEGIEISIKFQVVYSETQYLPKIFSEDDSSYTFSFSSLWIKRNCCIEQLFCNFKYLFDFIDDQGRINLVSQTSEMNLWDTLGLHSNKEFKSGYAFDIKNRLALMNIIAYTKILNDMKIRVEDVICNVFNQFCSQITNLKVTLPILNDNLSKIRYIAPEIESILKKYKIYVEHGFIDLELVSISSSPYKIEEIPSKTKTKYIYADPRIENIMFSLFSNQGNTIYCWDFGKKYNNLYHLLVNEEPLFHNLKDYEKRRFDELISNDYLYVDKNGILRIKDNLEISILYDLYQNNVISYWHLGKELRLKIDDMINNNRIYSTNTLFTVKETEFFNYFLNKSFSNGEDLRNKYMHGSHDYDEQTMICDYNRLLILFILVLYKIIDDLICYNFEEEAIENN